VVGAIFSKSVAAAGPAAGLGPYLVRSLVWRIGLSLGGTTGYAINAARDFGPRLAHAILPVAGKGGSDWSCAPIPVIARSSAARWPVGCFASWAFREGGIRRVEPKTIANCAETLLSASLR
jgi:glycerol uptake facilitator-like aquaporin